MWAAARRSRSAVNAAPGISRRRPTATRGRQWPTTRQTEHLALAWKQNLFNSLQTSYFLSTDASASTKSSNNDESSSNAATQSNNKPRRQKTKKSERLIETTNQLLSNNNNTKMASSSWTQEDWEAAERSLFAWTRQPKVTTENVRRSFQLLELMVHQAERQPLEFQDILTTQHLNMVLDRWRIASRYRSMLDMRQWSAPKILALVDDLTFRIDSLTVDTKTYTMIMAVQIKHNPLQSPKLCNELLNRMKQNSSTAPPNSIALTHVMDAHVKSGHNNAALNTQSIFDYMVDHSKDPSLAPTEKSLTRVLQAWVDSGTGREEAAPHMERSLEHMLAASKANKRVLPNSLFLNLVLDVPTRGGPRESAPLFDALMSFVYKISREECPHLAPDSAAFGSIISLWTKSGLREAPDRAEYWLNEMCRASRENPKLVKPPRGSLYTSVIAAWEKSGLHEAPTRGEALWKRMVENPSSTTAGGYYLLLSLWSKSTRPDAPMKAEELLRDMVAASKRDSRLYPSCPVFVNVISCWRKSNLPEAPYRAQAILDLLLEENKKRPSNTIEINDVPFNTTIHAWATSKLPEAEARISAILDQMKTEASTTAAVAPSIVTAWSAVQTLSPDSVDAASKATSFLEFVDNEARNTNPSLRGQVYKKVLHLWSESSEPRAAHTAEEVLLRYLREPKRNGNFDVTTTCYEYTLEAWKRSNLAESEQRQNNLLDRLIAEADRFYQQSSNPSSFARVAKALAKSDLSDSVNRVEQMLELTLSKCTDQADCRPKTAWFTDVIQAFVESGKVEQGKALLKRIDAQDWGTIASTTEMYVSVVGASARCGHIDQARELLERMVDLHKGGSTTVKPTARCFGVIMKACADKSDFVQVEDLWNRLEELQSSNPQDPAFKPDSNTLAALCKSDAGRVAREDSILYHILENARLTKENVPDESLLNSVLDSLVKSGDATAGKRAETILLKMQELYEEGSFAQPTFETFQKVIDCWVDSNPEGAAERAEEVILLAEALAEAGDSKLRPTLEGYMSVVRAWSNAHTADAPERIQRHLRKMKERFDAGKNDFEVDERAYSALCKSYANSGRDDAAVMAQTVFDETPDHYKCTDIYNSLILAQGGDSNKAEAILQEMERAYMEGNDRTKPSTETFNNVLLCWSRSGSPIAAWRADGLFNRMSALSKTGQLDVKPNGKTFDMVIATLANEWGADAASKVDLYLDLLKEYYRSGAPDCVPSVASYTDAIRAWGSNLDDPRAVLRAKALLDEMHELAEEGAASAKPDRNTYLVYLEALSQSSVEGKAELANDVVSMMQRNEIELDGTVLSKVQRCSLPIGVLAASWTVLLDDREEFPTTMTSERDLFVSAFP